MEWEEELVREWVGAVELELGLALEVELGQVATVWELVVLELVCLGNPGYQSKLLSNQWCTIHHSHQPDNYHTYLCHPIYSNSIS